MSAFDFNDLDNAADETIISCLTKSPPQSFFLYAGAGSGKTRSLVKALVELRDRRGEDLWMRGKRIGVITYTRKATEEIARRLEFNALIEVSTIHSFAWSLLHGHTVDIKKWLEQDLRNDIAELETLQAKGRPGTKAAAEREASLRAKYRRLMDLPHVKRFVYSPTENKRGRDGLAHSEVISCVADLLRTKPSLQRILVSRFPILLIDESQDTNRFLMDSLLEVQRKNSAQFGLGLFGDTMQRIYADGKVNLTAAIPPTWATPAKSMNHRSRERIVRLVNRIRSSVDRQAQRSREDKPGGTVRLFVFSRLGRNKSEAEALVASTMAQITSDENWKTRGARQTLILEHHMAAKRLGFSGLFEPLYDLERIRTGILEGTLPALRFLTEEVLPFVRASVSQKQFEAMASLRKHSPLLSSEVLKTAGSNQVAHLTKVREAVRDLLELWGNDRTPSIEDVLKKIVKSNLFAIPESLLPFVEDSPASMTAEDNDDEDRDQYFTAWNRALKVPFSELAEYADYIRGLSGFDTHQGVKGLEFERVMVIIDDEESRGFMFSYDKLLGIREPSPSDRQNEAVGEDTSIDRTRRLFYVTCSRAEESLAVVAYSDSPIQVAQSFISQGLFERTEVEIIAR